MSCALGLHGRSLEYDWYRNAKDLPAVSGLPVSSRLTAETALITLPDRFSDCGHDLLGLRT
jgi:hypothetical protein